MKAIKEYALSKRQGVILNANENPNNIDKEIIAQIKEAVTEIPFHRYPDDHSEQLIEAFAKVMHMHSEQIMAGNGSDELIGLLIGLWINQGQKVYTMELDFSMYDYYVSMHDGLMIKYDWNIEDAFDVNRFIQKGKDEEVDMIIFSNPNNPTGRVLPQSVLCTIIEAFPKIKIIIDEAYADFDETTMITYIDHYPNVLVTRTLSKAYALAGIRCGFLLTNRSLMKKLKPYKVPYNVNSLTQMIGTIVLAYHDEICKNIALIKKERDRLYEACTNLQRTDLKIYPSSANYLYGRCEHKQALLRAFEKESIMIRNYSDDSFRISIGTQEENELVLNVLETF